MEHRIIMYLTIGEKIKSTPQAKADTTLQSSHELHFDTIIGTNHRCTKAVRDFFKSQTNGAFHFSLFI